MMAFLGTLVLTSCGNDGPDERDEGPAEQAVIMFGERVYQANCATCHGPEGEGEPNWQSPREDGTYPAPPTTPPGTRGTIPTTFSWTSSAAAGRKFTDAKGFARECRRGVTG